MIRRNLASKALAFSLLAANLFAAIPASAQSVQLRYDVKSLAMQIQLNADTAPVGDRELLRVRALLSEANAILSNTQPPPPPPGAGSFACRSRDNDGFEPFQLAYLDPETFTETKIPNSLISRANCDVSIRQISRVGDSVLFCASRDNDTNAPYAMYSFGVRTRQSTRIGIYSSMNDCFMAKNQALTSFTHVSVCISRDNDGNSPYVRGSYDLSRATTFRAGETYSTLSQCISAQ